MNPSVYLYKNTDHGYEVYLGEFSTLEALMAISSEIEVELIKAGASSYKKYGWATASEFPEFRNIGDIISFLIHEQDIGLIHFEVLLKGLGKLSTHDDAECHFYFNDKASVIELIKSVSPINFQNKILADLMSNPGKYISINKSGEIQRYYTFEQFSKDRS